MKSPFPKINIIKTFNYLLLLVITSLILFLSFNALPQTEKLVKNFETNAILSDKDLTSKTYKVEVTFEPSQLVDKWKLINKTKNIIYSRLNQYGVEFVNIKYEESEQSKGNIFVNVITTKPTADIEGLISPRGQLKVVIKKDDANFEDEKNPYAMYLPDSYNDSTLYRGDFRTVYVTQLKTTSGEQAYFGIFKPWVWNTSKFDKFITDNGGKTGGINFDGFVTPITIPVSTGSSGNNAKPILTMAVGTNSTTATLAKIVYNSGEIPIGYTYKDSTDNPFKISYDLYRTFAILSVSILIAILISVILFKTNFLNVSLIFGLSIILLITFLKFTQTPFLSISLLISIPLAYTYMLVVNNVKSNIASLIILLVTFIMALPVRSVFIIFAPFMLYFVAAIPLLTYLVEKYIKLFKTVFKQ